MNTDDNVDIENVSIAPEEVRYIDVKLNDSRDYAALQFEVQLPEGLELLAVEGGERANNHGIVHSGLDNDRVRIIGYNMQNIDFADGEGGIVRLKVKATRSLDADATIHLTHTVLSTADGDIYYAPATSAHVSNASGVTDANVVKRAKVYAQGGMIVIESQESAIAQLVSINGTSINLAVEAGHNEYEAPAQGVYIVRIGGESHKLILK